MTDKKKTENKIGHIYICTHPIYPDWIKIGYTKSLKQRLTDYNAATPIKEYKLESIAKAELEDLPILEELVRSELVKRFIVSGREWFKCDYQVAEKFINEIATKYLLEKESIVGNYSIGNRLIILGRRLIQRGLKDLSLVADLELPASLSIFDSFIDNIIELSKTNECSFQTFKAEDKEYLALHFPTFYKNWKKNIKKNPPKKLVKWRKYCKESLLTEKTALMELFKSSTYYVDQNVLKRLRGKTTRCLILSLAPEDKPPVRLLEHFSHAAQLENKTL
jgi:hypothetical protein